MGKRLRSLVRRFLDVRDLVYAHIIPVIVDVKSSFQLIVTEESAFSRDAHPGNLLFYLKVLFRNDALYGQLFCPLGVLNVSCPIRNFFLCSAAVGPLVCRNRFVEAFTKLLHQCVVFNNFNPFNLSCGNIPSKSVDID